MNKLNYVIGAILIFSLVSIIVILTSYVFIGATNDYVLYEFQEVSDDMHNQTLLKDNAHTFTQETGDSFTAFNFHIDDIWLILYIAFWTSSMFIAYRVQKADYFSFLGGTFYIVMVFLFLLSLISTITDWIKLEILVKLFPTAYIYLPKFYYYLDHIGIFSALQFVICLLINVLDFDLSKISFRRKQEETAIDEEVL